MTPNLLYWQKVKVTNAYFCISSVKKEKKKSILSHSLLPLSNFPIVAGSCLKLRLEATKLTECNRVMWLLATPSLLVNWPSGIKTYQEEYSQIHFSHFVPRAEGPTGF